TVQVTRNLGGFMVQSTPFSATVAPTAPELFVLGIPPLLIPNITASNGSLISPLNPAKPGDIVKAMGTGFGVTNLPLAPGTTVPASPPYSVVAPVKVTVGNFSAVVSSVIRVPGGLGATDQVTFQIPPTLQGGPQPVVVSAGGQNSQTVQLQLGVK